MRAGLPVLLALAACSGSDPNRPGRAGSSTPTSTGSTFQTSGEATLPEAARIELGTPWLCADSLARADQHYDRHALPGIAATEANLVGGGIASADFDGDGWLDLFIAGEASSQLWRGTGVPSAPFEQTDWLAGLSLDNAVGGFVADLDADGLQDLVVLRWGAPNLWLRSTGSGFEDRTPAAWLAATGRTTVGTAADLDGDGDLDVVFMSYGDRPDDSHAEDMGPADPSELYEQRDGDWIDRSASLPPEAHDGYAFAAQFIDLEGDGLPEGFVAHDFGTVRPSLRLGNSGGLSLGADPDWHPESHDMSLAAGDVNRDGVPDFLITSVSEIFTAASGEADNVPGVWIEAGPAWALASDTFGRLQHFGWAAEWADVDNDADLDAIALYGHWDDWFTTVGQLDALWLQIDQDPPLFADRAGEPEWAVADGGAGRGLVAADLNHDGWIDLAKREIGADSPIYLSRCGDERAISVALQDSSLNRSGIGARVALTVGDQTQTSWILSGGTGFSGGPPIAHFGVGSATVADVLEIRWPDGEVQRYLDVPTGQPVTVHRAAR